MSETIRVVVAEPGMAAEIKEVDNGLDAMQALVEGNIEPLRIQGHIFMVVNEEGKLKSLPPNRLFSVRDDGGIDPGHYKGTSVLGPARTFTVLGPMFVTKTGGSEFVSLTEEEAEEFRKFLDEAQLEFDAAEVL